MGQFHTFSPLDKHSRQIRLLKLHSGTSEIRCDLEVVLLDDCPHFEALSYTWGDAHERLEIILNGCPFSVTSSLGGALQYLRKENKSRTLWIDAICINQSDDGEKMHQVEMMRLIYEKAAQVLVWLGGPFEDSDLGMDLVELLADSIRISEDYFSPRAALAYTELLNRPYWDRMWIMQEVAVASVDPIIGCGSKWISWSCWRLACTNMFELLGHVTFYNDKPDDEEARGLRPLFDNPALLAKFFNLDDVRDKVQRINNDRNWDNSIVSDLLSLCQGKRATNPRDYIYATLGLIRQHWETQESTFNFVSPDYTKSVSQVYCEAFKMYVELEETLEILHIRNHCRTIELPSWVPDFSAPQSSWYPNYSIQAHKWNASGTLHGSDKAIFRISDALTTLHAQGAVLDSIQEVVDLQDIRGKPFQILAKIHNAISKALKGPRDPKSAEPDEIDVIWQTVIDEPSVPYDWLQVNRSTFREEFLQLIDAALQGHAMEAYHDLPLYMKMFLDTLYNSISIEPSTPHRMYLVTQQGMLGLGPPEARTGDILGILRGYSRPVVLRATGTGHSFVGSAMVRGIMRGEAVPDIESGKGWEEIVLK